jgi:hypothetical protein
MHRYTRKQLWDAVGIAIHAATVAYNANCVGDYEDIPQVIAGHIEDAHKLINEVLFYEERVNPPLTLLDKYKGKT